MESTDWWDTQALTDGTALGHWAVNQKQFASIGAPYISEIIEAYRNGTLNNNITTTHSKSTTKQACVWNNCPKAVPETAPAPQRLEHNV